MANYSYLTSEVKVVNENTYPFGQGTDLVLKMPAPELATILSVL